MQKSELTNGSLVKTRNNEIFIKIDNIIVSLADGGFEPLKSYDKELNHKSVVRYDIVAVRLSHEFFCNEPLYEYINKCIEWTWEREEKVKLTDVEKVILKNIPNEYKYICRDEDERLYVYENMPYKNDIDSVWHFEGEYESLTLFKEMFKFIKFEDEEPYLIEDLLKESENDD